MRREQRRAAPRIGILGGTFDPVHNGHLLIARAALRRRRLDRVIFVPARRSPHKASAPCASAARRLAMVRLAVRPYAAFSVSDCEVRRRGPSYTIDTLRMLRRRLGRRAELFFIVGSDSLAELRSWKSTAHLLGLCTFIVAARPGARFGAFSRLRGLVSPDRIESMKDFALRSTRSTVSATEVRTRVAAGRSIAGLVPPAVARYIRDNGLYTREERYYHGRR